MKPYMPAFPALYGQTNGADGLSARLCVAAQIAASLSHKLLPNGVWQNFTDRRIQARQSAVDAMDIAEMLIQLDADREKQDLET